MNIFCIEQNYLAHKQQRRIKIPGEPLIFVKPQRALLQPGTPFYYPKFANELYGGCELVLRICVNGKDIKEKLNSNYYDSISVGINFTALDDQDELNEEEMTWEKAKVWDNSSVSGKWMPATNFKNKEDINFCLYKNRELMQLGNSGLMINNFDTIISGISKTFPVNIGDLIFTGTPVGISKLVVGDKLEAFIEDDSLLEFDVE
jgi:2-keto-4-pentenoate hydratase/2-oxohepta-3-ene-1,7-dioic acid hydratase in catechol pathway